MQSCPPPLLHSTPSNPHISVFTICAVLSVLAQASVSQSSSFPSMLVSTTTSSSPGHCSTSSPHSPVSCPGFTATTPGTVLTAPTGPTTAPSATSTRSPLLRSTLSKSGRNSQLYILTFPFTSTFFVRVCENIEIKFYFKYSGWIQGSAAFSSCCLPPRADDQVSPFHEGMLCCDS